MNAPEEVGPQFGESAGDNGGPPGPEPPPEPSPRNPREDDPKLARTLTECAKLDQSDTDNGKRLIAYFGRDLTMRAEAEVQGGTFLCWTGTHWDVDAGAAGAMKIAQKVGPLLKREAEYLQPTPDERKVIEEGNPNSRRRRRRLRSGDRRAGSSASPRRIRAASRP
jgi:putative DNA primase/helicase